MWMKDVFGTDKPIIGVLHMHALPTDPKFDAATGVQGVLEAARADLKAYQEGGIDGILFCNCYRLYIRCKAGNNCMHGSYYWGTEVRNQSTNGCLRSF